MLFRSTTLSANVFKGCLVLENVNLPSALRAINASAFEGCAALQTISLPNALQTIHSRAFANSGLTKVWCDLEDSNWIANGMQADGETPVTNAAFYFGDPSVTAEVLSLSAYINCTFERR